MEKEFIDNRVLIGQGKIAKVYLWNGFAYKCFDRDYPADWIEYEMGIQRMVNAYDLKTVKYYESEVPNSIKMDYIEGISLANRVFQDKYKESIEDLFSLISSVHRIEDIELPRLNPYLTDTIRKMEIDSSQRDKADLFISELPDGNTLCHLDFHFLNLLYSNDEYYIIDWINAKVGNPIYDYARSYVILYEFAYRLSKKFLKRVKNNCGFSERDFQKAVYVMAVHRLSEQRSDKVSQLLMNTDAVLKNAESFSGFKSND